MGRDFVIFFEEKEGSTPIVRLLDNFNAIDIVHQTSKTGWEPFDVHCCGPISMRHYLRCLELIYNEQIPYMQELNRIYTATARLPLLPFDKAKSVGFKMRFQPQRNKAWLRRLLAPAFRRGSINCFRANDVVVFVTVRQDVLRWALSKYHGDGTGRPGHLQFTLARGKIDRSQIPKIHVDLDAFGPLLEKCERQIMHKRRLIARLNRSGIRAWPMLYEYFCNDKKEFLAEVLSRLELSPSERDITAVLEKGTRFEKVHDQDIRGFVVNADDVLERFGERYVSW